MTEPGRSVAPDGYTAVTPWIISRDTGKLLDFVRQAFDAVELSRLTVEDGSIGHAEFRIGDAIVMGFDTRSDWPDTPAFLRLYVEDADETFRRAIEAGATAVTSVTPMAWGDRVGRVRDPFGNLWWIQSRVEIVDEAEVFRRMAEPEWIERMTYLQTTLTVKGE
jgi:PhnB protein